MFMKPFEGYAVGEKWRSRGRSITEADLVMFSALSGDWYPLHTDREWAAQGPYGQRIAHGMLLLSIATGLITMDPGTVRAFYGMDRVRFVHPVFIGDTVHVDLEVTGLVPKSQGGVVEAQMTLGNQDQEPVAVAALKILVS